MYVMKEQANVYPYCISSDYGKMLEDNYESIIAFIGELLPERLVISGESHYWI